MTATADKNERKKQLKEFLDLTMLPLVLAIVNSVFLRAAKTSFTAEAGDRATAFSMGISLEFLIMVLLVNLWARPAFRYVKQPDDKLKAAVRRRIGNIYRDGFLLLVIVQAVSLGLPALLLGWPSGAKLAASGVAFLAQVALLVVFVDSHLSKQKNLMEALYTPEELSHQRDGLSVPVYIKISMMVIGFAITPFALIYTAAYRQVPWGLFAPEMNVMLLTSAIALLAGLNTVYNGIQVPLDGLIAKMRRVAAGEFIKSRIYFSDEVASLKAGFNDMVDGLKEREELQETFGKYLSIEIARELIKNKKVNLGGEDMEAAVMFCDIRNFTTLSEKLSPSGLVEFLNNYFRYITPPITSHKGVINKFIGDAVMAIYTPLLGSDDYAADAVRAAAGMRAALAEFNAAGIAPGPVEFGIGIHAGRLVGGNVGTFSRLEYTFIGDTVNIASRLESKTRDFNTDILVSGPALELAKASLGGSLKFESLGSAALKGKREQVEIYKVL
ncbi:MAG: hypothetical protein A2X35_12665 [Elusimicrobia bacterium GWA2_61_42]|nr:MAG: hypothetical protein A2X35_12665 [Elusimicrobia bacterium GWA2_61_42]OGR75347.1 MAG: hypothetical protein A2X38_06110 [Elusimicrobia bacterium GWC2_61_25]